MTFFRRLRRPVAVLLLVCATSFFVCPAPSPALEPVTVATTVGVIAAGAASIYMRNPAAYNQMFARAGSWVATRGQGLSTTVGIFASAGKDKLVGFMRQAKIGIDKAFQWIKAHPGDAAEIAGLGLDAWQALMGDKGMPNTARAVRDALNPGGNSGPPSKDSETGDVVDVEGCGPRRITHTSECGGACGSEIPSGYMTCTGGRVYWAIDISGCSDGSRLGHTCKDFIFGDPPSSPQPQSIPDILTPEQEQRLLDNIERLLREKKEEMERELDELLKKNLDDIDWPEFDNDAAQQYLTEKRGQELQDKIDEVQDEIERRRQEREENCQQQNCQNQCCETTCDDARLANRLDQLKDRLDDLNQRQEDEAVNEYDPPVVTEVELKQIDFQPIFDLKGELMAKFPFNMLQLIPSAFELLTAEPVAPYWDANLGEIGGIHRVDFSVLDGLASFIRMVLSWLCYIGAVFCCLKIWSRF